MMRDGEGRQMRKAEEGGRRMREEEEGRCVNLKDTFPPVVLPFNWLISVFLKSGNTFMIFSLISTNSQTKYVIRYI